MPKSVSRPAPIDASVTLPITICSDRPTTTKDDLIGAVIGSLIETIDPIPDRRDHRRQYGRWLLGPLRSVIGTIIEETQNPDARLN